MKTLPFIKLTLVVILTITTVSAEYRVFQYYVKSKLQMPTDKNGYLVTSTLDPVSYVSYHGGNNSLKVDLLRTWKCVGHTGGQKDLCPGPEENSGVLAQK